MGWYEVKLLLPNLPHFVLVFLGQGKPMILKPDWGKKQFCLQFLV